jgi:Uma2 family endonuclease
MGLSFEEYVKLERSADYKSEFHAGEIYAMPGCTPVHSELSARMMSVLNQQVQGCRIFDSNLRLYISRTDERTWTLTRYSGKTTAIPLLGVELELGEIYRNILDS